MSQAGKSVDLSLWYLSAAGHNRKIASLPVLLAPIPQARKLSEYLALAWGALVLWLAQELLQTLTRPA